MSDYQPTPPTSTPYTAGAPAKSPVLSILALVFGILGILGSFFFGSGLLPAIAAIILGFLGRRKEPRAKGMWLTGIILGFVAVAISIIFLVGFIALLAVGAANPSTTG